MKICVIGTGYVGLVTGACLADFGNVVTCVDKDAKRIYSLLRGIIPFYEPGLPEIVTRNIKARRLYFSTNLKTPVLNADVIFITVGTPPKPNGEADISAVVEVAEGIAKILLSEVRGSRSKVKGAQKFRVIVNKSTVPVGMGDVVTKILQKRGISTKLFSVVSNPEFLREGSAISDFFNPDRIVVGASNNQAFNVITELYRPLNAHIVFTDVTSAEMIKYASNAFLATKISFINELSRICEKVKADVTVIADAMGLDRRIGRAFLNAGIGFGGSCFPKDVAALLNLFEKNGCAPQILAAVNKVNESQINNFAEKIAKNLNNVSGKKIAILGVAFKPETDDIREAPAIKLIHLLLRKGAVLSAYDPVAENKGKKLLPQVTFCPGLYEAVQGADAIVLATEWPEFRQIDLLRARKLVRSNFIFDGRNILNARKVKEARFRYFGVGR